MPIPLLAELYPGEAGWGDVLFVAIWSFGTLLLAGIQLRKQRYGHLRQCALKFSSRNSP